jgi:large conductance mechanosensitive channel
MKKFLNGFKDFVMRGNVVDMAIGIIVGIAFGAIVNSLVSDIIMPPIGRLLGKVDFSSLFINLSGGSYASLAEAKNAGAAVIAYGAFINVVINFIIVAIVVFFVVQQVNRLSRLKKASAEPTNKDCPYCLSSIPIKATRCPYCTSELAATS